MSVGGIYEYGNSFYSTKDNGQFFWSSRVAWGANVYLWGEEFSSTDVELSTRLAPKQLADWGEDS